MQLICLHISQWTTTQLKLWRGSWNTIAENLYQVAIIFLLYVVIGRYEQAAIFSKTHKRYDLKYDFEVVLKSLENFLKLYFTRNYALSFVVA